MRVALNAGSLGVEEAEAHATLRRKMRRILLTIVFGDRRCLESSGEEDRGNIYKKEGWSGWLLVLYKR